MSVKASRKKILKPSWVLALLASMGAFSAWAGEPAKFQELFTVHLDLEPSKFWSFPMKKISGDIPVMVITDAQENIVGLQLSKDSGVPVELKMKDGSKKQLTINTAAASSEKFLREKYRITVTGEQPRDLLLIDATGLDPQKGGPIELSYSNLPLIGSLNEVHLNLKKMGHKWVVESKDSANGSAAKIFTRMTISTGLAGMGLKAPEFQFDPNQLASIMKTDPISDPKVADAKFKKAEEVIQHEQAHPIELGDGASIRLVTEAAH